MTHRCALVESDTSGDLLNKTLLRFLRVIDLLLVPFVYLCAWLLRIVRHAGVQNLPLCRTTLLHVGVFPIRNHYYEPQFDNRKARLPWSNDRSLPGIKWNIQQQLRILSTFKFAEELEDVPSK